MNEIERPLIIINVRVLVLEIVVQESVIVRILDQNRTLVQDPDPDPDREVILDQDLPLCQDLDPDLDPDPDQLQDHFLVLDPDLILILDLIVTIIPVLDLALVLDPNHHLLDMTKTRTLTDRSHIPEITPKTTKMVILATYLPFVSFYCVESSLQQQ